ncbi:MAG: hypothetical protein WC875_02670 [Candidatus Absconditabacterales bacterium]|jgi:hypothetical protein
MFKNIVANSIKEMNNDRGIIRLTWITSFCHSLIAILLIIIDINSLIAKRYDNGLYIGKVAEYFVQEISRNNFLRITILITASVFLIYSIIYPIGQAAIIHYIHDKKRSMKLAIQKGKADFFPMFEFGCVAIVFSPIVYFLTAFKVLIVDNNRHIGMLIILVLWFTIMTVINSLRAYTRYMITIERMPLYEAMKKSFALAIANSKNTARYMRVQTILLINFSLNLLVVLGIPFLVIYGAIAMDIIQYSIIKILVFSIFFVMIIIGSYISAIIRAFFVYYRYKIYKNLTKK